MKSRLSLSAALTVLACGGDDSHGDGSDLGGSCALRTTLTGAAEVTIDGGDSVACGIPHSSGTGLDIVFLPSSKLESLSLEITAIAEGETGSFGAEITITTEAGQRYRTAPGSCTVEITEHTLEEIEQSEIGELRRYQTAGTGVCNEPARSSAGTGDALGIGEFAFRSTAVWAD